MVSVVCALMATVCLQPPTQAPALAASFLYEPAFCIDDVWIGTPTPYVPQPGDIMLRLDGNKFWRVTHYMALAFDPNGSAIVYQRPDGSMAILEAGPNDCMSIKTMELLPHLKGYANIGRVWIRRRAVPLTAEQSAKLTEFALQQENKWFALQRLGLQLTPFRARGPLRTYVLGKPNCNRISYYCSELVCEACCYAGLLDPERTRPSATYPCDLFYGRSYNLFINRHLDVNHCWYPPARWIDEPVVPCPAPVIPH